MTILRLRGTAAGRSTAAGFDRLLWVVANSTDPSLGFREQAVPLNLTVATTLTRLALLQRCARTVVLHSKNGQREVFGAGTFDRLDRV